MRTLNHILLILFLMLFFNCKSAEKNRNQVDLTTYPPVETKAPNTQYKPAFEGQTRAPGLKTVTSYEVKVLSESLNKPWSLAALPDGRLLITEKAGIMRIANVDGTLSDKITGIPAVNSNGQGGLQGVTLAPDFSSSRMVYFVFSENTSEGNALAVAKGKLSANESELENVQVIYRALPYWNSTMHYGGSLVFDKNGDLFVSTGERSVLSSRPKAQMLDNALGKIVHITKDGNPVLNGPFANTPGARPEIYSYGHRNPLGIDIHPVTGDLWEGEMGPRGGDEINLIKPGKNYGWPAIGYGIEYSGEAIGDAKTQQDGMEQPIYYWDPVLSPGGLTFYKSKAIPEWENNLFITGLSSKHIARLVLKNNKVIGEERIMEDQGQRVRDVIESKGVLFAITDEGRLYRIGK